MSGVKPELYHRHLSAFDGHARDNLENFSSVSYTNDILGRLMGYHHIKLRNEQCPGSSQLSYAELLGLDVDSFFEIVEC